VILCNANVDSQLTVMLIAVELLAGLPKMSVVMIL